MKAMPQNAGLSVLGGPVANGTWDWTGPTDPCACPLEPSKVIKKQDDTLPKCSAARQSLPPHLLQVANTPKSYRLHYFVIAA